MGSTRKMRVLLADGHQEIRTIVREYISHLSDFQVIGEAVDGIQAVEAAERLNPDVVVLDFELARKNGMEATRMIKERKASTKVIVSTLFDDPLYRAMAEQVHVDGIIVKSSLKQTLQSVFSTIIRQRYAEAAGRKSSDSPRRVEE